MPDFGIDFDALSTALITAMSGNIGIAIGIGFAILAVVIGYRWIAKLSSGSGKSA